VTRRCDAAWQLVNCRAAARAVDLRALAAHHRAVVRQTVPLPSGTVTFLFTDVEASTKLLGELGAEGYADALAEHRRLIRAVCGRHGGVEVDTQ
jgi:class 3 adenylate cyclase